MNKNDKIKVWSDRNFFKKEIDLTRCYTHYNCSVSLHAHTFYEINIVVAGRGIHHIFNTNFPVARGNMFIIPQNTPHSYHNDDNLTVRHILIADGFFAKYQKELEALSGFSTLFKVQSFLPDFTSLLKLDEAQFKTVDGFWRILELNSLDDDRPDTRSDEICILSNSLVLSIISFLCKEYLVSEQSPVASVSDQHLSISKSIEYITNHYDDKISTTHLAALCNMSESSFLRSFKSLIHSTPMDYLISQRIAHAKILLKTGDDSMATIAQNTGFFDSAHFTKTFKRITGMTPLAYRNSTT